MSLFAVVPLNWRWVKVILMSCSWHWLERVARIKKVFAIDATQGVYTPRG